MQLYIGALNAFATVWHKSERVAKWLLIFLGYRGLMERLTQYKETAMLTRMETLMHNVQESKTYGQLEACKDLFTTWLLIPYPEYTEIYYRAVSEAIYRKEQQLNHTNN